MKARDEAGRKVEWKAVAPLGTERGKARPEIGLHLLVAAMTLMFAGCARPQGDAGHEAHAHEAHAAATYKAGHGIQLNEEASQFVGLRVGEVETRDLPGASGVTAVPEDAILQTIRGSFVFVENGGWLLRSPVTPGAAAGGWVEIKDGLYEGDRVAVAGVHAIWLAEIAAVNGGVGCADGH